MVSGRLVAKRCARRECPLGLSATGVAVNPPAATPTVFTFGFRGLSRAFPCTWRLEPYIDII